MRLFLLSLILVSLCGCHLIYRLPTRQGNVIEQKDLDKLKVGMTRDQVRYVMGTPLASNPFRSDRWDYVGYYRSPRGDITRRTVTLNFNGDQLASLVGVEPEKGDKALSRPDAKAVLEQEDRDRAEARRDAENAGGISAEKLPNP
jgi:outer membrane protein assembly factor BamE (lipoprotein component of BamABCDE complex)